jgi:hypothetical protein
MNSTEDAKEEIPKPNTLEGALAAGESSLITLEELLRQKKPVKESKSIDEDRQQITEQTIKERETMRIGQEKYFELRGRWSNFIAIFVTFMLMFQLYLAMSIGLGWLNFTDNKLFLHIVIGENFAQIVGMGYIVAKYLFPNSKN